MQIVKNSTTVGRRMTTGSDSLPLVSFSDTYQPLRNRNNRSSVDESQSVIARLDLVVQVGWQPYLRDGELAIIEYEVTCSRDIEGLAPSLDSYFCQWLTQPGDVFACHQVYTALKSGLMPKGHSVALILHSNIYKMDWQNGF